jgi:phosphatidate cytidylyltransferase
MALNIATFKTRALTAVVFVVVMLAGLLWNQWSFLFLFSVIHFGCWIEYQKLVAHIDRDYEHLTPLHKYSVMLMGWSLMLWFADDTFNMTGIVVHEWGRALLLISATLFLAAEVVFKKQLNPKIVGYSLAGLIYISLSWALMINLRGLIAYDLLGSKGWLLPVVIIASIWINDTMAYIVGSFIGKTPFSSISPKKTWEGTTGGALLAVALITCLGYFACGLDWKPLLWISALAAITGTVGDLLESKLKRLAGVKDSGSIMPGHGGFLDRFDSLLLATPFVWMLVKLIL